MKKLLLLFAVALSSIANAHNLEPLQWDSIANVDTKEIAKRAEKFLLKESPELKDLKIKLLEISVGWREGHKKLWVSFYHDQSYVEGSEHVRTVESEGKQEEHSFVTFDLIVIHFDENGIPQRKETFGLPYSGSKEEFESDLNSENEH